MSRLKRRKILLACNETIKDIAKKSQNVPSKGMEKVTRKNKEQRNEGLKNEFNELVNKANEDIKDIIHKKDKLKKRKEETKKGLLELLNKYFPTDDIEDEDIFANIKK